MPAASMARAANNTKLTNARNAGLSKDLIIMPSFLALTFQTNITYTTERDFAYTTAIFSLNFGNLDITKLAHAHSSPRDTWLDT